MYCLWRYFYPEPESDLEEKPLVKFGRWDDRLDYINYYYNDVATKLILFVQEAGTDKYDRYIDAEQLLDFAIHSGITDMTAEYIYRHYVYHLLSKHEMIDVDREEQQYLIDQFILIRDLEEKTQDNNDNC